MTWKPFAKAGLLALVLGVSSAGCMGAQAASSAVCASPEARLAGLKTTAGDPAPVERTIRWDAALPADAHRLVETRTLSGACAGEISGYLRSIFSLRSGETFTISETGVITPRDPAAVLLAPAELTGAPPGLTGATFVAAAKVDVRRVGNDLQQNYLGLWRSGGGSIVASFSQLNGKPLGSVKPVFRSSLPLLSIAYFPAPDSASGRIGVSQRVDGATIRLIGYDWWHPNWYPVG